MNCHSPRHAHAERLRRRLVDPPILNERTNREIDWLYAHFQSVSRSSNRYLLLIAVSVFFSYLLADGGQQQVIVTVQYFDRKIARDVLLGVAVIIAAISMLAVFGAYDMGESALDTLCERLHCDWSDIGYIDTFPSIFDYARHSRAELVAARSWIGRIVSSNLGSLVLVPSWLWLWVVVLKELCDTKYGALAGGLYLLAIVCLIAAGFRGRDYVSRRWKTYRAQERQR